MYLSRPTIVLAILAVGVASTAWLAPPPPREIAQATVMLPATTYQKLALWAKDRASADGRPLTMVQIIEELANK